MKKQLVKISAIVFLLMSGNQLLAVEKNQSIETVLVSDTTSENFKVYGNCGMCKRTIEGSLKDVKGIYSANWNKETKMIAIQYDKASISLTEIKKKIAAVGYDTEEHRASEESYKSLPGCCQYERPKNSDN